MSIASVWEFAARQFDSRASRFETPGDLAKAIEPRTVSTPALRLIDEKLVEVFNRPDGRLIISMPPQEGKSTRVAKDFVVWALLQDPRLRVATASYGQALATRNGRAVRRLITENPDLGLRIAPDNGAVHDWTLDRTGGGLLAVGIGGGFTGRPADVLIIDDPIKDRKEADSAVYRQNVWDWWTDVAGPRLAPGAPVVLILTRWHHDDLAGRLMAADEEWELLNIPAQANHRPDKGERDPLGREPDQFMESARRRTEAQWELIKRRSGVNTWGSLYQGSPTPDQGNMFPVDGWERYKVAPWVVRQDGAHVVIGAVGDMEIIQSWDFTFKDSAGTDFVVGQVWMRRGPNAFLLDQIRARMNFTDSVRAILDLSAKWPQAAAKLVEDKANGPAILNALRAKLPGLIPVEPEGSKYARAAAVSPFVEARNVLIPDPMEVEGTAWVTQLTEEARDFPHGAHDDTVDAMSQAVHRLLLVPILGGEQFTSDDLLEEMDDDIGWATAY